MDVKLVMFKSNGQRKDFPVNKPVSVIGRGENCELRVPLLSVSRRHCELTFSGDELKVKDLASSNGTYVNNERVNERALAAGDRLVIGPVVFTVQVDGVPEQIEPTKTRGQAAQGGVDDVIELEADEAAKGTAGAPDELAEDIDPISALEALAAKGRKKD